MRNRNQSKNESGTDLIYGRWPVREAMERGTVLKLFFAKGISGSNVDEMMQLAKEKRSIIYWVERKQLDQMTNDENHQGMLAQVPPFAFADLEDIWDAALARPHKGVSVLFLDGIMDPHNLGSILRSAVFFGVSGVIIPKWRAAGITSTVVRSSAGAARLIPIGQVANLATAMEMGKERGFWFVGADVDGNSLKSSDIPNPFGLVMGSEGEGIHHLIRKKCDYLVKIDGALGRQGIDSLNVGVAAGILLHQFS
ncbi:MAG: 23S rRNA (guanosine(2251)-2'-O)-methyltransferase RlmB [Elusimicrobiota bacterium]